MAGKKSPESHLLENAITLLIQVAFNQIIAQLNQDRAAPLERLAALGRELADLKRETAERFLRIEQMLLEQRRVLGALPEAVCRKVGFKPSEQQ